MILFDTEPSRYRHWRLAVDGAVATLTLAVAEDGGLEPGYKLKLNSYDLGVDIELNDAIQRLRFEHPAVRVVVLTSGLPRMFSAGANIYMLAGASHAAKVNFCKFTNETRCGMEESSRDGGLKFVAALNGSAAGGGYELALACDEILMVDDRSSTVSLPEVPLLAVLPGTGGLTRLVDKRRVRRDLADLFCTRAEGCRADRALDWGLVDATAPPNRWAALVAERAAALAAQSNRSAAEGIRLTPLERRITDSGIGYSTVSVEFDGATAIIRVRAPDAPTAGLPVDAQWWPLRFARELDDAILMLRTNWPELGLWRLETLGDPELVLTADRALERNADHWAVRETIGMIRRTLRRLDVSSRSLFAVIDRGSCFAGTLFELALVADRSFMLDDDDGPRITPTAIGERYTMGNCQTRLATRFSGRAIDMPHGRSLDAREGAQLGLVTVTPDALDWDDELRVAIEERTSLSGDALTGLEASLRFAGPETPETKIYGRLSAWQNWVFARPNAAGPRGALKAYGSGQRAELDRTRV